jgi:hypothetical protein
MIHEHSCQYGGAGVFAAMLLCVAGTESTNG